MESVPEIAKLHRPRSHAAYPRERLFSLLDGFREHPVRWLAAPPGAGKTTLASAWLEARQMAFCWYRADERDDDPASLFYYLGEAAWRAAGHPKRTLPLFTPEYGKSLSAFSHRFFEALFALLPRPFALVIDDFHKIPAESLSHRALLDGFGELPPGVGVVILSRQDPPAGYARLSVSGTMDRIPASSMRLDKDEVRGLLKLRGISDEERIGSITERGHGWAAGIQLLLEAEQTRKGGAVDPRENEVIFSYFAGEVFSGLPESERRVLLCAALQPACSTSLACLLSGETGAGAVLERLYRRNYFVTRDTDSADPLYRLHPLFQEYLLEQVRESITEEEQVWMRLTAAGHLEQNGKIEGAIALRLAANDAESAGRLIAKSAAELLRQGRHRTVAGWIDTLPSNTFNAKPWLLYWKAMACQPFDPGAAIPLLTQAFEKFREHEDTTGIFRSWAAVVQSIRFDHQGDGSRLDCWIAILDEILMRHPDAGDDETVYSLAQSAFHGIHFRNPLHPKLEYWKDRAIELAGRGDALGERNITFYSATTAALQSGRLDEADKLLGAAPAPDTPGLGPIVASYGFIALSMAALYRGQFDAALDIVDRGLDKLGYAGTAIWSGQLAGVGVAAALGRGDAADAERRLLNITAHWSISSGTVAAYHRSLASRIAYAAGSYAVALSFARESVSLAQQAGWGWPEAQGHLAAGLAAMEARELGQAHEHLAALKRLMSAGQGCIYQMHARLADARLALLRGDIAGADNSLTDAIDLGARQGMTEFGLLRADIAAELWARALTLNRQPDYVRQQIRLRGLKPPPGHTGDWPWPVRLVTLGRFAIVIDGVPLRFTGKMPRKPLELLQAVVAFGGRGVSREAIQNALWPDADGDAADTSLRVTLSRLRRLLRHKDAVIVADGKLNLDEALCSVDIDALRQVFTLIDETARGSLRDASRAEHLAARLVDIYRGGFLADQREHAWMLPLRKSLQSRFVAAAGQLGDVLEGADAGQKAIALYKRALEQDSLAEPIYRRLMLAHLVLGQKAEALDAYRRCREMLSIMLGVGPSPETEAAAAKAR